jgi:hypothetical protein
MWGKLNANERLAATGAVVVLIAWLVGIVTGYGFGVGTIPLLAAIGLLVVYYLKYAPNQTVNWPMPIPTIALGISAIAALLAILTLLQWIGFLGTFAGFFAGVLLSIVVSAVGTGLMAYGTWKEYQETAKPAA